MPPLLLLFDWRRGMNCLQEGPRLLISDNCVTPGDVAICDAVAAVRVLYPDYEYEGQTAY